MTNNRTEQKYDDADEMLMNDDLDFIEEAADDDEEQQASRPRAFNMDMRHRIEDRLEQRRLQKELNEYEYFDLEDGTLH